MNLTEMMNEMRHELQEETGALYSATDLTRAIQKSVSLMSRLIPKRAVVETTVVRKITDETLTIASNTGTLTYKPVKVGSLVITGKTLDTDYRVNYLTGVVTEIGSNLPDTDYTANYELDPLMLDISSLLSDYIKVERMEYPAGNSPVSVATFDVVGDFVVLRGSNLSFTENEHARLTYLGRWTAPLVSTDGDYPSHLDDAIIIGSVGQALIFKAEKYVREAATLIGTSNTTLGSIGTPVSAASTALGSAMSAFAAAISTLTGIGTPQSNAGTALGKVAAEVAAGKTFLTSGAPYIITANVATDPAGNYQRYATAQAQLAAGYANEAAQNFAFVGTYIAKSTREAAAGTGYVQEAIQRLSMCRTYLDKSVREEALATRYLEIAGRYLASGQAKINEFLISLGFKPEITYQKASPEQRT